MTSKRPSPSLLSLKPDMHTDQLDAIRRQASEIPEDHIFSNTTDRRKTLPRSRMDIYVHHLDATVQFYALAFGFALQNVVLAGIEAAATLNIYEQDLAVRWIQRHELFGRVNPYKGLIKGFRLQIEVEDVMYVVKRAWEAGAVAIEDEDYKTPHRSVIPIQDPDGVVIDLIEMRTTPL